LPATVNFITEVTIPTRETTEGKPEVTQKALDRFIKDYKIQINKKLNLEEKFKFQELHYQYKDIFARNISEMQTYLRYQLELHPKNPFVKSYTRQYKLNDRTSYLDGRRALSATSSEPCIMHTSFNIHMYEKT